MNLWFILLGAGAVVVIGGTAFLFISKRKKTVEEEIYEEEEETPLLKVEEENEAGCPDDIKNKLLLEQEKIFKEAHKVYLVITNLYKGKNIPPEVKKELETFLRSYNRIKEIKEEIEVYPFSDCDKVFHLKFGFYNNLVKETAKKLMLLSRSLR